MSAVPASSTGNNGPFRGVRLLCAADLHLGRQPSRIPPVLHESLSADALTPAAAWFRLVDLALAESVDAVVLAGDVVEQKDDFYEAYQDLRKGVEKLAEAGIGILAVAGNHDLEVLPRLAEAVPGFKLLGEGGEWESRVIEGTGGARLNLLGWSFPRDLTANDPLAQPLPQRGSERVIGVLHCDRDGTSQRYAPVRSADLQAADVDAWLLGHVHKPDPMSGGRPIGYLGSLTGMDPGEPGVRGAWLLEIPTAGPLTMRRQPLSPLRWEEVSVEVDGLAEADEVHGLVVSAVDALHEKVAGQAHRPRAVGVRLVLTGRSSLGEELRQALRSADPREEIHHRSFGVSYFVHDLQFRILPAVDIERLAQGADPAGLLAARLLLLRGAGDPTARRELLRAARERLTAVANRRQFQALAPGPVDDERLDEILQAAALEALEDLLAQKELSR